MVKFLQLKRNRIGTKLLFWFIGFSITPLIIVSYFATSYMENAIVQNELQNFILFGEEKLNQINVYFQEQEANILSVTNSESIIDIFQAYNTAWTENGNNSTQYVAVEEKYMKDLQLYALDFDSYDLYLINKRGDIIFSLLKENDIGSNLITGKYSETELGQAYRTTVESNNFCISKYRYYLPSENASSFLVAPIIRNEIFIGAVAIQIRVSDILDKVLDFSPPGKTGEVMIGELDGDSVAFLSHLKLNKELYFDKHIKLGSEVGLPIQYAVTGGSGNGFSTDYKNNKILAVWYNIPGPNWGLVVKMDKEELFRLVVEMRKLFLFTGIILLLIAIVISFYLSQTISNPIKKLQYGIRKIGSGNLRFKVRNNNPDEIGELSRSFDDMTSKLVSITASRDDLDKEVKHRKYAEKRTRILSKALEENPSTVIITDKHGIITYVNQKFVTETGYSASEALGHNPRMLKSGVHKNEIYENMWSTILQGKVWNGEIQNKRKNGELFWHSISISPIFSETGTITHFVSSQVDITERKKMDKELELKSINLEKANKTAIHLMQDAQEQRQKTATALESLEDSLSEIKKLSEAIEQSPVTVAITDINGNIEYVNQTFTRVTGYLAEEVIGKTPRIFKSGYHDDSFYKDLWETALSGTTWKGELVNKMKNGELRWESATIAPIKNESGEIINLIAIKEDITDRKHAEERFRLVVESAPNSIILVNSNGIITLVNSQTENYFGYSRNELIGKKIEMLIPYKKAFNHAAVREQYLTKPVARPMSEKSNLKGLRKDSTKFSIEVGLSPIVINNETLILTSVIDITERNFVEKQLRNAKNLAEEASRTKSMFLTNMSHEIRTPLNSILGFSEVLSRLLTDKIQKDYISSIKSSGKTLLSLIDDILELSKIDSGKLELVLEYLDIRLFVKEVISIFTQKAESKGLKLIVEIADNLPNILLLDELRLKQVLINLINNAIKFTETGFVRISLTPEEINSKTLDLFISVEDSGIGIDEKNQKKIFESFVQQDGQDNRRYGGTGLGLTISKQLIKLMNGEILLESRPNEGSKFLVCLKNIKFSDKDTRTYNSGLEVDFGQVKFEKSLILNVDDILSNITVLEGLMGVFDFEYLRANSGAEALKILESNKPDIIFTDLVMPNMDGYDLVKIIRKNPEWSKIPVIAVTASVFDKEKETIRKHGFDGYIRKPVTPHDLLKYLKNHIAYTIIDKSVDSEIDTFSANVKVLPQVFIEVEENIVPLLNELIKIRPKKKVENLATMINDIGVKYGIMLFEKFGKELHQASSSFNFEEEKNLIEKLPNLIHELNKLKKD